jgi:acetyltransferase-like isoleucine patch superfamily enzyme
MINKIKRKILNNLQLLHYLSIYYRYFKFNKIKIIGQNNRIKYTGALLEKTSINIKGENNQIFIEPLNHISNVRIDIFGDNNYLIIHRKCRIKAGNFWFEDIGGRIEIGENTLIIQADLAVIEGTAIIIGKDSMLAYKIDIRTGDSHSIIDQDTNSRLNPSKDIIIGEHVWIGSNVLLLKGVHIGNDCIVGAGSIVNKKFTSNNSIIAGNPAKVMKEGINWKRERI